MNAPKTMLLLVIMLSFSVTLTGCAGIGAIFSGLLDGVMASFGDLFTAEGFMGFLGNVLGSAAQELGPQLAEGNMDGGDIWGSLGNAALGELGNRAKGTDWGQIAKDGWANRNADNQNQQQQDAAANTDQQQSSGTDQQQSQQQTDDQGGGTNDQQQQSTTGN